MCLYRIPLPKFRRRIPLYCARERSIQNVGISETNVGISCNDGGRAKASGLLRAARTMSAPGFGDKRCQTISGGE